MFDRVLNIPLRGHSKCRSLRKKEREFTKRGKNDTGRGGAAKKVVSLTQNLSVLVFLQINIRSFLSILQALITLQWAIIKNTQKIICAFEMAILPHPKHYGYSPLFYQRGLLTPMYPRSY